MFFQLPFLLFSQAVESTYNESLLRIPLFVEASPEKRRRYDSDFRAGAVGIVRETNKRRPSWPGISESTPGPWRTG
jgi:hypothetical protein